MAQDKFKRKLTTIFSADGAGCSRLMQDDKSATVKTFEAYKQIIFDLIKQHLGQVSDSQGDNLLAELASVVDTVHCAVAAQKELQAHNAYRGSSLILRLFEESPKKEVYQWPSS